MTNKDFIHLIKKLYQKHRNLDEYEFIALRFENKSRQIGEICENSKDNPERDDEREFPEYGTEEYNNLTELEGTSTWELKKDSHIYKLEHNEQFESYAYHCYVVASNDTANDINHIPDQDEILLKSPIVLEIVF